MAPSAIPLPQFTVLTHRFESVTDSDQKGLSGLRVAAFPAAPLDHALLGRDDLLASADMQTRGWW